MKIVKTGRGHLKSRICIGICMRQCNITLKRVSLQSAESQETEKTSKDERKQFTKFTRGARKSDQQQ